MTPDEAALRHTVGPPALLIEACSRLERLHPGRSMPTDAASHDPEGDLATADGSQATVVP